MKKFVSFFKDFEEVVFIVNGHVLQGTYRKGNSYFISLELKDLCLYLNLSIGEKIVFKKKNSSFRDIEVIFPIQYLDKLKGLEFLDKMRSIPHLELDFPSVTSKEINYRIKESFFRENPPQISNEDVLNGIKEYELIDSLQKTELICLKDTKNVNHYPHQIETVRRVLFECRGRAILADEVGMGKTIEAGLTIKEYILRNEVKSVLILTPASLTTQWQEEMETKFDFIFHTATSPDEIKETDFLIMSLDTAKSRKFRESFFSRYFDIVIIDEAHKLKNRKTLNHRFVKGINSKYLLLLTATPIQNDLVELYNLIHLIAPGALGTLQTFRKAYINPLNKRMPMNSQELKDKLAPYLIRHTRAETKLKLPDRKVILKEIFLEGPEKEVYALLTQFVQEYYYRLGQQQRGLNQLTLMLLQKLITSSPLAMKVSVENLLEKGGLAKDIEDRFHKIIKLCDQVKVPAKFKTVLNLVLNELKGEKIVIFTQFRSTQNQLAKTLENNGVGVVCFHGEMSLKQKNKAIIKFRDEVTILLSTDAGAEGRNLQFAHYMINFDLPWNPMKVEQRIGRIHRMGQTHEVFILNLCTVGTIEEHIVNLLSRKIRLFERIVGELEMIVGYLSSDLKELESLDRKIMDIIVKYKHPEEQSQQIDHLGNFFTNAGNKYEEAKEVQEYVFGGDKS
ncbi:MAG: hypothetical protein COB02_03435 [Candidatus Cloacimonadota bacterium]|nr:MAG: hypothetical protein COB02_03435 [Candidatus Cloacimonadota bacterium]